MLLVVLMIDYLMVFWDMLMLGSLVLSELSILIVVGMVVNL